MIESNIFRFISHNLTKKIRSHFAFIYHVVVINKEGIPMVYHDQNDCALVTIMQGEIFRTIKLLIQSMIIGTFLHNHDNNILMTFLQEVPDGE